MASMCTTVICIMCVSLSAGLSPLCGHGRWSPPRSQTPSEGTGIGTLGSSTWLSSCFKVMVKLRIQKVCTYNSIKLHYFDEIQFSRSVLSNSLQPHGLQHTRLPSPSPTPIELVTPSNHLILCCPLLLLPSIFPSITIFSNESVLCIRWPKFWSFNFSISPSNEYSGLISFRMDWLDLRAVQVTVKSLLQHHSSEASILRRCFLYSPTLTSIHDYWKTIALTRWTSVGKVLVSTWCDYSTESFLSPIPWSLLHSNLYENCLANDALPPAPILVSHPDLSHVSEPCGQWLPGPSGLGFTSSYYSSFFYIPTAFHQLSFRLFRSQVSVHPTPDPAPFNYLPQATGRWLLGTESSPPALRTLNKPPLPEAHLPPAPSAAVHPVAGDLRPSR